MPRYFLHLHNNLGPVTDEEGQDLPDLEAAHLEAIRNIRGLLSAELKEGQIDLSGRIEIFDEPGNLLRVVPFTDAVRVEGLTG